MDEQTKSTIFNGFSNVVRQCQIPGLDVQRLSMAFRMTLDALEPGAPVELQPLFDYLVTDQKLPEKNVLELCVVLKSREQKIGVTFLPATKQLMPYMSVEQADKIVAAYNQKADKSGVWDKSAELAAIRGDKSSPGMQKPAELQPKKDVKKDVKKGADRPRSTTPIYAGILGLLVVACVAFYVWREQTREPEVKDVTASTQLPSGSLPCAPLTSNGTVAFCDIPAAMANNTPPDQLATQAGVTKAALVQSGVKILYVRAREENRIVLIK